MDPRLRMQLAHARMEATRRDADKARVSRAFSCAAASPARDHSAAAAARGAARALQRAVGLGGRPAKSAR